MKSFSDLNIKPEIKHFVGEKIATQKLLDKEIIVKDFNVVPSKFENSPQCLHLQIEYKDEPRVVFTVGKYLIQTIEKVPKEHFPFKTKIIKNPEHLEFS